MPQRKGEMMDGFGIFYLAIDHQRPLQLNLLIMNCCKAGLCDILLPRGIDKELFLWASSAFYSLLRPSRNNVPGELCLHIYLIKGVL
jgi:hypothetical protein